MNFYYVASDQAAHHIFCAIFDYSQTRKVRMVLWVVRGYNYVVAECQKVLGYYS